MELPLVINTSELKKKMSELNERREKRIACYLKNKVWLDEATSRKGKGRNLRRNFRAFLLVGKDKVFETEEDEYQYIKKFGRGEWVNAKSFTEEEQQKIVEIGKEYGSFVY